MDNFGKYADLDLPLVPGERVVYITEGADLMRKTLVIATNKRLLLARKGLSYSYTSLFYNTVAMVHFRGSLLMPAVLIRLNGTDKLKVIRTRNAISAKSLFSILSNRIIIDHDVAMTYRAVDEMAGLEGKIGSRVRETEAGILNTNMVEVIDRIEEANGAFAEMVRQVENNVIKNSEAKKAASVELNIERAEKLQSMLRSASRGAVNTAMSIGSHINAQKQHAAISYIDFASAAKRLEKISISGKYDPALFVPNGIIETQGSASGSGVISARIEGMLYPAAERVHSIDVIKAQEAEISANTRLNYLAANAESAGTAPEVNDARTSRLVDDMLMFKIRDAKDKLSNMHFAGAEPSPL